MSSNRKPAAEQEVEQHQEETDECRQQRRGRNVFTGKGPRSPRRRAEKQDVIYTTEHTAALNHHDNHLASTRFRSLNHIRTYATR